MRKTATLATILTALCAPAALPGGASLDAAAAGQRAMPQDLILLDGTQRLKPGRILKYEVGCARRCELTTSNVLHLPGRDLGPLLVDAEPLEANEYVYIYVGLNKAAKRLLLKSRNKARLRTTITATEADTGHEYVVNRSFRFQVSSGQ